MAKYDVRVRYTFEGTYKVVAEDRDEAERIVTEDCGLVLGGNIHTTRDDDEVTDWRFGSHPDMQILSFRERVGKGKVRYTSMCFSDRIEELRKDIIEAIRELLDTHGLKKITFTDNEGIHALNREYRNVDRPTDVLSFPLSDGEDYDTDGDAVLLGDIVISLERAQTQAEEYGHSFEREVAFLTVHSMLHLLGYDHETSPEDERDMFARQDEILISAGMTR